MGIWILARGPQAKAWFYGGSGPGSLQRGASSQGLLFRTRSFKAGRRGPGTGQGGQGQRPDLPLRGRRAWAHAGAVKLLGRLPEPGLGASGPGNATTVGGEALLGKTWETSQKEEEGLGYLILGDLTGFSPATCRVHRAARSCLRDWSSVARRRASGSGATSPAGFGGLGFRV